MLTKISYDTITCGNNDALTASLGFLTRENVRESDISDVDPACSGLQESVNQAPLRHD